MQIIPTDREDGTISAPESGPVTGLGGDLPLDLTSKLHAWLSAFGFDGSDADSLIGLSPGSHYSLIVRPEYREMLRRCHEVLAAHTVDRHGDDIDGLFNSQIKQSASVLMQLRDNPLEKGMTRLKAASQFLDRAPDAPKMNREITDNRKVIVLPVAELQNMQSALLASGEPEDLEIHDLLRGRDWTDLETNDVEITLTPEKVPSETTSTESQ